MNNKKTILEKGKILTNGVKMFSVILAISYNAFHLIKNKTIPSFEEQKSILLLCAYPVIAFSTIDISLIFKNIFQKRTTGVNNDI